MNIQTLLVYTQFIQTSLDSNNFLCFFVVVICGGRGSLPLRTLEMFLRGLDWNGRWGHIISVCLDLCYLVCLRCLVGISVSIHVSLAIVLYLFHCLVPGLRFEI